MRQAALAMLLTCWSAATLPAAPADETVIHVAPSGNDANPGTAEKPLRTLSAAARVARPGDVVTVRAGVYRERIDPPRGGTSDDRRITYQAAPGEEVRIKGSEVVTGWTRLEHDTWTVTLPDSFFGDFNPFRVRISGDWFARKSGVHHVGAVYAGDLRIREARTKAAVLGPVEGRPLWFAEAADGATVVWAQFPGLDPASTEIEVNVRQSVFYPSRPGINFITVRGFILEHAATPWAPPTAEQVGLVGTHWSRGWIIEGNRIAHAACVGVTLGKHGDAFDNKAESAEGYVGTIRRGLERGWSKENIGGHVVRGNEIHDCGQAGIVGSLGAAFSEVSGNHVHDIHQDLAFTGAEIAGIKFHGAVDTVIRDNHIHRCGGFGGIWLDWMSQGTRITGNLMHENHLEDILLEVNHGPLLVDNNILLSRVALWESSEGSAFVHNLVGGAMIFRKEGRQTPVFTPHTLRDMRLADFQSGDERFFNNIFFIHPDAGDYGKGDLVQFRRFPRHHGLTGYGEKDVNVRAEGNVFLAGTKAGARGGKGLERETFDPESRLLRDEEGWWLEMKVDAEWLSAREREIVTTERLGKAMAPDAAFEHPDGSPYRLLQDYLGRERNPGNPAPGALDFSESGTLRVKVWPKE
jgi:alpha-N-arabinofuranosidase